MFGQSCALRGQQAGFCTVALDAAFLFLDLFTQARYALGKPFGRLAGRFVLFFELLNAVLFCHFVSEAGGRLGRLARHIDGNQVGRADPLDRHLVAQRLDSAIKQRRVFFLGRHAGERILRRRRTRQRTDKSFGGCHHAGLGRQQGGIEFGVFNELLLFGDPGEQRLGAEHEHFGINDGRVCGET